MNTKTMKNKNTEYFVPIKNITNGMIVLDNGEKVTGVKIIPKNIFILDEDSQYLVINSLKNFYNTLDFEFWIITADKPVDISFYMSKLQILYNNEPRQNIKKLILEDINKGNMFTANNVVDTEYFFLFKEKNQDLLLKRIRDLINGFNSCGLNSNQTSNEDLRILLDNFLNGNMITEFGTVFAV